MGRFGAQFGRDGEKGVGAAGKIGGEVEGGGGGQGDRARRRYSASRGRLAAPAARPRPTSGRVQDFRRDQRHGPRPAQPEGEDAVERPKGEDLGVGGRGVREGGKDRGGRLGGGGDRIPCPALFRRLSARASASARDRSSAAAAAASRRGVEAGRPAGEVAPERRRFAGGRAGVADGEAQVAQSRCVGVEAQDFGRGRGAPERQTRAERAGGGRIVAQKRVEQGEAGAGGEQGIAPLPFRSPAPRLGSAPAAGTFAFPGFSPWWRFARARLRRRANGLAGIGEGVGNEGRDRRESPGHDESSAALCHLFERTIRPACRG